jgi:hypothetical protein
MQRQEDTSADENIQVDEPSRDTSPQNINLMDIELENINDTHSEEGVDDLGLHHHMPDYGMYRKKHGFLSYFFLACILALVAANLGGMTFWYNTNSVTAETTNVTTIHVYAYVTTPSQQDLPWKTSWENAGYIAKVLGKADAMSHPFYELASKINNGTLLESVQSYLAVSNAGGGFLSDISVYGDAVPLPKQIPQSFTVLQKDKVVGGTARAFDAKIAQLLSSI